MLRAVLLSTILILQSCSFVSRVSVYPLIVGETPLVESTLSAQQISEKLQAGYQRWQATPYRYGHQAPGLGADCSGFTQSIFNNQFSIKLPRTTRDQINSGQTISLANARAGDLVFFNLKNGYGHVAIYLNNNIVIQATSSKGVTKTNLNTSEWWSNRVFKVKRIIK